MCESANSALTEAAVTLNEKVAAETWRMLLSVPQWGDREPLPGQFLMLSVTDDTDPLLARPFGISGFTSKGEGAEIEIIYRVVGRGTRLMERWKHGHRTTFLGPLGNGFTLPPEGSTSLLIAGGVGLPPLLALARKMEDLGRVEELCLVYGEVSRDKLIDTGSDVFPNLEVLTCTEDGSCGTQGMVTGLLEKRDIGGEIHLFACGPNPMMKAVMELTPEPRHFTQYSLEARMACGFGVCSGCAVKVVSGDYVRVCREGPVFRGSELALHSFGEA